MQQSQVINMTYKVFYAPQFVSEVERILRDNTEVGTVGTSERVSQVAFWIEQLLLFIKRIGNLADMGSYKIYGATLAFDTSTFDTGIGEFLFTIYYDSVNKDYVIYITDINWNFKYNPNNYYSLMTECKNSINQIITEVINQYLRLNLILN